MYDDDDVRQASGDGIFGLLLCVSIFIRCSSSHICPLFLCVCVCDITCVVIPYWF